MILFHREPEVSINGEILSLALLRLAEIPETHGSLKCKTMTRGEHCQRCAAIYGDSLYALTLQATIARYADPPCAHCGHPYDKHAPPKNGERVGGSGRTDMAERPWRTTCVATERNTGDWCKCNLYISPEVADRDNRRRAAAADAAW